MSDEELDGVAGGFSTTDVVAGVTPAAIIARTVVATGNTPQPPESFSNAIGGFHVKKQGGNLDKDESGGLRFEGLNQLAFSISL